MYPVPDYIDTSKFLIEECPNGQWRTFSRKVPLVMRLVWLSFFIEDRRPDLREISIEALSISKYKVFLDIYIGTRRRKVRVLYSTSFTTHSLDPFSYDRDLIPLGYPKL